MGDTQKLSDLCAKVRMTVKSGSKTPWEKLDDWQQKANGYRVTLRYQGRQMSLDFYCSVLAGMPEVHSVMDSLVADSDCLEYDFDDWCRNLGFDSDSRKAERIYKACIKQTKKLKNLLGDDFEKFLYAERD